MSSEKQTPLRQWPAYNTIWRWHFYAGLFCIPFVFVLAISGGVYLFKPQVEAALDQPYNQLSFSGKPQTALAQVNAALAAVPNSTLNAYILPETQHSAVRVLLGRQALAGQEFVKDLTRVYVHPQTLQILKTEQEDDKLMQVMHELHGNLLIGNWGSYLVELAASWAIVMLITGLYLWWPRHNKGLAGILYPRLVKISLNKPKRLLWRDLHAVTGFWIAFFTLLLLLSGLPWAKSWGSLLKEVRQIGSDKTLQQDWAVGRSPDKMAAENEHAHHNHQHQAEMLTKLDYTAIDRLVATVQPLNLAAPVIIYPPSKKSPDWTAKSKAQNRPLRVDLVLDASTGAIKSRKNFADRPLLDRIIGYGIAIHEGQLFGWFNQLLGLLTALGLVLLSVSGAVLWWRRRTPSTLGVPPGRKQIEPTQYSQVLIAIIVLLGVLLPFLGLSLIFVLLVERYGLRYIPAARNFLGLN